MTCGGYRPESGKSPRTDPNCVAAVDPGGVVRLPGRAYGAQWTSCWYPGVDVDVNIEFERAAGHFADVARGRDWSTAVPTCPGRDVNRIVGHLGRLAAWTEILVSTNAAEPVEFDQAGLAPPEAPEDRQRWLDDKLAAAVKTFRATPDESPVWTLAPNGTARFWKRRVLHELVVHAVDIEIAYHLDITPIDAAVAQDGIDEFLDLLPHAPRLEGTVGSGSPARLALVGPGEQWHIDWVPPGFSWHRGHREESSDVRVAARSMQDLYLYAYGRPASRIETRGDHDALDRWRLATQL
jgi:uncharacterized protein (TIGR03083 family)